MIRRMTIEDYSTVHTLWLCCPGMGLNNLDDSRDGIGRFLARNSNTCFVCEEDGVITGVILSGHDGRRGFIYHTAVHPAHRRKGIGTELVNAALEALRREGIHKAALVVFGRNESGSRFWEAQGFTERTDLVYRNRALTEMIRTDT